ncbi:hydrolase domain protein [Mycobacterium xenopi 4042]|uniref:Hydrolase domain protein n=1 Tax=Mycobacterium xenopi 4042 TaxID=1299334 RepID=X8CGL1_MYCXE|nr:hydrolase domain protein [Mycobacterium xenopi 4042]
MSATSTDLGGRSLRTRVNRLTGRALGRLLRLPEPTSQYTVNPVRIPMRDGVELLADHYAPTAPAAGTLLVRGPTAADFRSRCSTVRSMPPAATTW